MLNAVVELGNGGSLGVVLVGAVLQLLLITAEFCVAYNVSFVDETQRSDDAKRHLAHLQQGGHRTETALIHKVHQRGVDYVVAMVAQGNLVAAKFLGEVEELLASVPGTEKAGLLLFY